jgi:hypothetical protein
MNQPRAVAYGEEVNADQLLESASQIKTFTEGTDPESSAIADIQRCAGSASRVVFLGFAFHRQNLKLLWPKLAESDKGSIEIFATALNISETDVAMITQELLALSPATKRAGDSVVSKNI